MRTDETSLLATCFCLAKDNDKVKVLHEVNIHNAAFDSEGIFQCLESL